MAKIKEIFGLKGLISFEPFLKGLALGVLYGQAIERYISVLNSPSPQASRERIRAMIMDHVGKRLPGFEEYFSKELAETLMEFFERRNVAAAFRRWISS